MAELFGYQKILYENMEDISNILTTHENFSNNLADEYDQVMLTQDNDITTLEEKLRKLNPDEKRNYLSSIVIQSTPTLWFCNCVFFVCF